VGPRANFEVLEKGIIASSCQDSNPRWSPGH